MNSEILTSSKKQEIVEKLNKQFGIESLPYLLFKSAKGKIRAFSGSLSRDELNDLFRNVRIETIGLYLASLKEDEIRLSFDASSLLRKQITKNIIEISEDEMQKWLRGEDIEKQTNKESTYHAVKYKDYIIGCTKPTQNKLLNFVPKERRIKS